MLNIGSKNSIMEVGQGLNSLPACTLKTEILVESIVTHLLHQKEMNDYGK